MSYVGIEANIRRYLLKTLVVAGASWVPPVPVRDADVRAPFNPSIEDEAMVFRFVTVRRANSRANVWSGIVGFEVHCMTKRGDLRVDKKTDRHIIMASQVEDLYRADIQIFDALNGDTNRFLGALQGLRTETHLRDKRNTVFGAAVDYSVETPNVMQAVVAVTGLFQTSL